MFERQRVAMAPDAKLQLSNKYPLECDQLARLLQRGGRWHCICTVPFAVFALSQCYTELSTPQDKGGLSTPLSNDTPE